MLRPRLASIAIIVSKKNNLKYKMLRSGFKTSDQVSRLNAGLHVLILKN
jgi:hypothetical protein